MLFFIMVWYVNLGIIVLVVVIVFLMKVIFYCIIMFLFKGFFKCDFRVFERYMMFLENVFIFLLLNILRSLCLYF